MENKYTNNKVKGAHQSGVEVITPDAVDFSLIQDYGVLLLQLPWKNKRKEIIARDGAKCCHCEKKSSIFLGGVAYSHSVILGYKGKQPIERLVQASEPTYLEVHHKKYILSRLPWDYAVEDLETLCHQCHLLEHENVHIPVYRDDYAHQNGLTMDIDACWKCGGNGQIPEYHYHENGVCFGCNGLGFVRVRN